MADWHLAQLNIARLLAPIDSPRLAGFVAELEAINALAEAAPGFLWRLQDEAGDATGIAHPFRADMIVNLSAWTTPEALQDYVYGSRHVEILRRRRDWFHRPEAPHFVMWWRPAGSWPDLEEARERLALLTARGESPDAFTFRRPAPRPGPGSPAGVAGADLATG